jgi:hypothetical protein
MPDDMKTVNTYTATLCVKTPISSGSRTSSVHGALSVSFFFFGAPRPKVIANTSVYKVLRPKQLSNCLENLAI